MYVARDLKHHRPVALKVLNPAVGAALGDRAIEARDIFVPEDFFDPLLDPLRADPRFARIEKRMGIVP